MRERTSEKFEAACERTRALLAAARRPVLLSSFGKDSVLLLEMARRSKLPFDVLWYRDAFEGGEEAETRFGKELAAEWDLSVYSYPSHDRYLVRAGERLTLVSEYDVGGDVIPLLQDIEEGERCALSLARASVAGPSNHGATAPTTTTAPTAPTTAAASISFPWDVTLTGFRFEDAHEATGPAPFPPDGTRWGATRFFAPLREWTAEEVWEATAALSLPYDMRRYGERGLSPEAEVADLALCARCLQSAGPVFCPAERRLIDGIMWQGREATHAFRRRFGFPAPEAGAPSPPSLSPK